MKQLETPPILNGLEKHIKTENKKIGGGHLMLTFCDVGERWGDA